MKKKSVLRTATAMTMALGICLFGTCNTVYAATYVYEDFHSTTGYSWHTDQGWEQDSANWRWCRHDDIYLRSGWHLLDGNDDGFAEYYYIGDSGYLLMNTTTPDGYQVNADGARIVNDTVQLIDYNNHVEQEKENAKRQAEHDIRKTEYDNIPGFLEYKQLYIDSGNYADWQIEQLYDVTREQLDWLMENPDQLLGEAGMVPIQFYFDKGYITPSDPSEREHSGRTWNVY